ncbi:MAG: hypothetical protein H0U96_04715 [Acidobacteria bacterium]|nr:hypothetical protein [Acidobacteriota bacterium]
MVRATKQLRLFDDGLGSSTTLFQYGQSRAQTQTPAFSTGCVNKSEFLHFRYNFSGKFEML